MGKATFADLISIKMPTEEELQASSAKWLELCGPTFIDNWPADLLAISAPTTFIDLPKDAVRMFDMSKAAFIAFASPLAAEIDKSVGWDRHFFRLNSRSPKDTPWPFETLASCSGKEIMGVMRSSERILDDLAYFSHSTAIPKICLREFWPSVTPEYEFRCFIADGETLAVAEYRNRLEQSWRADASRDQELRANIDRYLSDTVKPRLHISTVVVDIAIDHSREFRLIEINPYGSSDPVGAVSYKKIEAGIPGIARLPA